MYLSLIHSTMADNSIVHAYLYGMIKREVKGGNLVHISQIHPIIKWCIRIPRKYQLEVIRELVALGFLKKIGRDNYEISTIKIRKPLCDSLGDPLW